jgi:hypothetical protein
LSQRSEGSRFGASSYDLVIFVLACESAKDLGNRRLPGITQRDAFTLIASDSLSRVLLELQTAGQFPGAACFNLFRLDQS